MVHITLVFLVVQFAGSLYAQAAPPAAGQAAPAQAPAPLLSPEERANRVIAIAVDAMAANDADRAVQLLGNLAATNSNPLVVYRAMCLGGAAMAMAGDVRPAEDMANKLNGTQLTAAQATWKQVLPECVRQLQAVAPKAAAERRAGLYYFLGLVGTDESEHVRYLREALKLRPDMGEAVYQLGVHLLGQGEMDEAAQLFRRVAEQHPEWAEPRLNLGVVLNLTGHPVEAAHELREALKIRPEFAEVHAQLGMALYGAGNYDEALAECDRAMQQEPGNPFHYNCGAVVLLEKNRLVEALTYARRANDLAPTHETFLVVLAAALLANGHAAQAQEAMRRAVAAQPRLRSDPNRLERADLLRGKALALARELLAKMG